jgi:pantetheine-phosphate adenylyltransferase
MTTAIYAGSFDPITIGHLDIISRSFNFCDELIVAIGINPAKKPFFSEEDRKRLIADSLTDRFLEGKRIGTVTIVTFQGLLTDYIKQTKAKTLIRGIRSVSDFEYEINLAGIYKTLAPEVETAFLPTSPDLAVVSSSMVKEIARFGGDVSRFVTPSVKKAIDSKFGFIKYGDDVAK